MTLGLVGDISQGLEALNQRPGTRGSFGNVTACLPVVTKPERHC